VSKFSIPFCSFAKNEFLAEPGLQKDISSTLHYSVVDNDLSQEISRYGVTKNRG